MLNVVRSSKWTYSTSDSVGGSVDPLAAEVGAIVLKDPSGQKVSFEYGAVGGSIGWQLLGDTKVDFAGPLPKVQVGGGQLYILDTFSGAELSRSDLTGGCMLVEAGAGFAVQGSTEAFLLGMNLELMASVFMGPIGLLTEPLLFRSAKAVLFTWGLNTDLVPGMSAAGMMGVLV